MSPEGEKQPVAADDSGGGILLAAENVSHRFPGGALGLENVSAAFRPARFVIIAGRNGSGKTLLARHLVGLASPSSGRILLGGKPIRKDTRLLRRKIGLVFQDADCQLVGQSVEEELRFGPENLCLPEEEIQKRVSGVSRLLGLESLKNVPPSRLSGGEKRRLAIGGVLAMEPEILVLDEPFANLDYPGVVEVLKVLTELKNSKRGVILITHELEKTLAHADRLIIMDRGRIAEDGPARETAPLAGKYGLHPLDFASRSFGEYTWLP
ncbi:MAG: energy-coupling factor ABC transporter ATP-binding protein [Spirochaetia bacterium]|jgi:biotin transport system ATP-binding protein|nr:energy-coupling factor ABC transporter ATP-binding protein [Spirochaetia bacterium]